MTDELDQQDQPVAAEAPLSAGGQLRAAREARGLSIAQLAASTRISASNIALIEAGNFDELPARIYAIGFAKSLAKAVGADPGAIAETVRAELGEERETEQPAGYFSPGDPARAPSGRLLWFSLFALALLLIGLFFASKVLLSPAGELPSLIAPAPSTSAPAPAASTPAAPRGGAVVFTALEDEIWVKFYDGEGNQLMQKQMARGERYTVPADAVDPQIWTGRPDALSITIGGRAVPKLSDEQTIVRDVAVSAEALLARARPEAEASPAAEPAGD